MTTKVAAFLAVLGLVVALSQGATGQSTRPQIEGIRSDLLEEGGVTLSLPAEGHGAITRERAFALAQERFGLPSLDAGLVHMEARSPIWYSGPVWAVSLSTKGTAYDTVTGKMGTEFRTEGLMFAAFFEGRTGEFLFASQAGMAELP